MKWVLLLTFIVTTACNDSSQRQNTIDADTVAIDADTLNTVQSEKRHPPAAKPKMYSNTRFKDVTVEKVADNKFTITGKGQIFEASFGWVVEDGHNELKQGFQMTDAGAPAWGNFKFTLEVEKQRENSSLTLILFETSAKDGSRQYELPVPLH